MFVLLTLPHRKEKMFNQIGKVNALFWPLLKDDE